jgi:hypothetical protein
MFHDTAAYKQNRLLFRSRSSTFPSLVRGNFHGVADPQGSAIFLANPVIERIAPRWSLAHLHYYHDLLER